MHFFYLLTYYFKNMRELLAQLIFFRTVLKVKNLDEGKREFNIGKGISPKNHQNFIYIKF